MKEFLKRFIMTYLPIQTVADLNEVDVKNIKLIYHKNKNDERFKIIDGKLYVMDNYMYPYADELKEVYFKALMVAGNENRLSKDIAQLTHIKQTTVQKYFYRFTAKHIKKAKLLINALHTYIAQNSLFDEKELNYG